MGRGGIGSRCGSGRRRGPAEQRSGGGRRWLGPRAWVALDVGGTGSARRCALAWRCGSGRRFSPRTAVRPGDARVRPRAGWRGFGRQSPGRRLWAKRHLFADPLPAAGTHRNLRSPRCGRSGCADRPRRSSPDREAIRSWHALAGARVSRRPNQGPRADAGGGPRSGLVCGVCGTGSARREIRHIAEGGRGRAKGAHRR
jgi:hypothetical protein